MRKTKQIRSAVVCCCLCVCVCVHLFIYFRVEKQTRHGRHMNNVEKTLKVKKTQSIYSQEQQPAASSRYYHGYIGNRFPLFLFFLKSRVLQSHAGCVCVCVCGDCVMRVHFSNSLWELIHYLHYPVFYTTRVFFYPWTQRMEVHNPDFSWQSLNLIFISLFYFFFNCIIFWNLIPFQLALSLRFIFVI